MEGVLSYISAMAEHVMRTVSTTATAASTESSTTESTTENMLDRLFDTIGKAEKLSSNIMDIIYILAAMVIVVAIFTVTLYIFKFFRNRRDPNYRKNDDTFLDD